MSYGQRSNLYLSPAGDLVASSGRIVRDGTIASRAMLRLRARRGSCYYDSELGSRLHELKTLEQARRKFLLYCKEALKPMLDAGEIKGLTLGGFETDAAGVVLAQLLVQVSEEEYVKLETLPLGRS